MIKNWKLFKESISTKSQIRYLCEKYDIKNYTINDDLSIDVNGDVYLEYKNLDKIPLKFRNVIHFYCSNNQLTSLWGCPESVEYFDCGDNNLTSLEFCPKLINDGSFFCYNNQLTSLEHLPNNIEHIDCEYNNIWSFKGIPDSFRGDIICKENPIEPIWKLFESPKDIEFFNDCDIVREPETPDSLPIVVIERLNFFLETIGKPTVKKFIDILIYKKK
jgi:hypothetical protein